MSITYGVESSLEGPRVHPTSRDASSDNSHDLREQLFTRDVENVYNNNGGDGDDERPGNVWSRSGYLDDKKKVMMMIMRMIAYHVFRFGNLLNIVWGDDGNN